MEPLGPRAQESLFRHLESQKEPDCSSTCVLLLAIIALTGVLVTMCTDQSAAADSDISPLGKPAAELAGEVGESVRADASNTAIE